MSPVKRKTWNQSEYFRQMPIVGGTLTECVLDLPESSAAERGRLGLTSQVRSQWAACQHYSDQTLFVPIGANGFEPSTSCSQGRRASQAALRPVRHLVIVAH